MTTLLRAFLIATVALCGCDERSECERQRARDAECEQGRDSTSHCHNYLLAIIAGTQISSRSRLCEEAP